MSIRVRPIEAADKNDWLRLWDGFFAHFGDAGRPRDICDVTFARFLDADPRNVRCLVAEVDHSLAGFAHYVFHRHGWWKEDTCFLEDLFTDPQMRGRGVGRLLIEGVQVEATQAGCRSVYWWTQRDNPARPLYASLARELREDYVRYHQVLNTLPSADEEASA